MGYLNNATVTVDAILTNKGRQLLAAGGQLNITKFALSDDEIDYDLWNPAHTLGTNYYGKVIEDMPILEALPDETQNLKYKLITLPKDAIGIPIIQTNPQTVTLTSLNGQQTITVTTINLPGANNLLGYTAILSDDTYLDLMVAPDGVITTTPIVSTQLQAQQPINFIDDEVLGSTSAGKTITKLGYKFIIKPKSNFGVAATGFSAKALLTIIGNETGGFVTIPVLIVITPIISVGGVGGLGGGGGFTPFFPAGGSAGAGTTTGGGGLGSSDIRLKNIIKKIGISESGIGIYLFNYKSDPSTNYQGVIAQELLGTDFESAVSLDQNGFYVVDYSKIDVVFKESDEQ